MEVSEKDIETLREAIDGCGGSSYTQAIAILDRLSLAPEPDVDEATKIWREMRARGLEVGESTLWAARVRAGKPIEVCEKMFCAELSYLRQAIAELIASKDGEIERISAENFRLAAGVCIYPNGEGLLGDDHGNSFCSVEQERKRLDERETELMADLNKAEAELAALRAENERLAGINSQLVAEHNAMNQDGARLESELAALRAENERLKDTLNTLGTRWALRKAAERNTAGPLVSLASGEPKIGGWTSDAKYAPNEPAKTHVWPATHDDACSEIKATETTPDVVVTQADCQREQWARNIASYTEGQARNHVYECAINLLTEAEARGRREALEVAIEYLTNNKIPRAWELRRLMTEPKP